MALAHDLAFVARRRGGWGLARRQALIGAVATVILAVTGGSEGHTVLVAAGELVALTLNWTILLITSVQAVFVAVTFPHLWYTFSISTSDFVFRARSIALRLV